MKKIPLLAALVAIVFTLVGPAAVLAADPAVSIRAVGLRVCPP